MDGGDGAVDTVSGKWVRQVLGARTAQSGRETGNRQTERKAEDNDTARQVDETRRPTTVLKSGGKRPVQTLSDSSLSRHEIEDTHHKTPREQSSKQITYTGYYCIVLTFWSFSLASHE